MVIALGHQRSFRVVQLATIVALIAFAGAGTKTQSPAPGPYGVMTVISLGGAGSAAYDIGEYGQPIVGRAQTGSGSNHAFAKGYYGEKDLGTLGGPESTAFAAFHQLVVGQSQLASGQHRAFAANLMTNELTNLGTLGGTWSAAYDARNEFIVGAAKTAGDARMRAFQYVGGFQYAGGTMTAVPVDLGGDSVAKGVTSGGDIVGYACTATNACRPFLFSAGVATLLGPSGRTGVANAINDDLEIAGSLTVDGSSALHAFYYFNGSLTDLGTLGGATSEGLAINDKGEVVGTSQTAGGEPRAFLWRHGVMTDLNTLLPAGSGWVLESATSISYAGQIVGNGTLNGMSQGFLLTPPTDLELRIGGTVSLHDSNLPRDGVEAGKRMEFTTSVIGDEVGPVYVYGVKMVHTLTGPAEFVEVKRVMEGDSCELTATVVTCTMPFVEVGGSGREVQLWVRTTGVGPIAHHATVTSSVPDPDTSNDSISESNRAIALSTFALSPASIAGGKISSANFVLTDRAPGGDAVLRLTSSRPDIAAVPATFIIPSWTSKRTFNIVPAVVSTPTTVDITATYGLVTITRTLTVVPGVLRQLYLTPTTVIGGCGTSAGRILLTGTAPPGGGLVPLSNTNAKATVPASVTVPGGHDSTTFSVSTAAVTSPTSGVVTARYGGVSQSLNLTVRPIRAQTLTLSPNRVRGGTTVNATVTLECPAMPGAVGVSLTSGNASVANPAASAITLPAGATTGSFSVRTSSVASETPVAIYVWVFGVRKSATLTVTP